MKPRDSIRLREVMHAKVATALPEESATTAWDRMRAIRADGLVVTRNQEVLGVLSWHDLTGPAGARAAAWAGARRRSDAPLDVPTATPNTSVERAAGLMCRRRIECLPILERRMLVGVVTTSDLLRVLARGMTP